MKILGIETSCDETAAAVVEDGTKMLSNEIASQVEIHARYGGIVPEVASRQHTLSIIPIIQSAMSKANVGWQDLGAIAVTNGPGPGRLAVDRRQCRQSHLSGAKPAAGWRQSSGRPHVCQLADR